MIRGSPSLRSPPPCSRSWPTTSSSGMMRAAAQNSTSSSRLASKLLLLHRGLPSVLGKRMIHLSKFHPRPRKTKLVVKGRKPCSLEPKPPWPIPRGRARSPKSPRTLVCQPTNGQPSPPSSTQVSGDAHSTIAHWVADSAILAAICMPVSNVGRSTHGTGITEPARFPHLGIGSPQVGVITFVGPMLGRMRSLRV